MRSASGRPPSSLLAAAETSPRGLRDPVTVCRLGELRPQHTRCEPVCYVGPGWPAAAMPAPYPMPSVGSLSQCSCCASCSFGVRGPALGASGVQRWRLAVETRPNIPGSGWEWRRTGTRRHRFSDGDVGWTACTFVGDVGVVAWRAAMEGSDGAAARADAGALPMGLVPRSWVAGGDWFRRGIGAVGLLLASSNWSGADCGEASGVTASLGAGWAAGVAVAWHGG